MKRFFTLALAALLMVVGMGTANADLPGQPDGIPEQANAYQWRFMQGNICFEDWTNGWAADAIQNAAEKISNSSDVNAFRSLDCGASGYGDGVKITFVLNGDICTDGVGKALVWTLGGYLTEGWLVTRGIVHLFPNCPGWWDQGTASEIQNRKRMLVNHEALHVFGFKHQNYPLCAPDPAAWLCRADTVMAANAQVNPNPTSWDFYRLDLIHPW